MLIKWLNGNVSFFEGIPLYVFAVCAYVCLRVMLERQKSGYRLTFDFFFSTPRGHGRNAEPQQWPTLSAWKEMGGVLQGVLEGFILVMVIGLLVWK